jgi:hypothetical protein
VSYASSTDRIVELWLDACRAQLAAERRDGTWKDAAVAWEKLADDEDTTVRDALIYRGLAFKAYNRIAIGRTR